MFQLYLVTRESEISHVVLDTKWLSCHIIGPTFAGIDFTDQFKLLPENPSYTEEELVAFYRHKADFHTLQKLLQSLELMVQLDDGMFTIPAKLPASEKQPTCELKYGRCVACEEKTMFAPILFPAIQARVFNEWKVQGNPAITSDDVEFAEDGAICFVWKSKNGNAICFGVGGLVKPRKYQDVLNRVQDLIILAINDLSGGTNHNTGKYVLLKTKLFLLYCNISII